MTILIIILQEFFNVHVYSNSSNYIIVLVLQFITIFQQLYHWSSPNEHKRLLLPFRPPPPAPLGDVKDTKLVTTPFESTLWTFYTFTGTGRIFSFYEGHGTHIFFHQNFFSRYFFLEGGGYFCLAWSGPITRYACKLYVQYAFVNTHVHPA